MFDFGGKTALITGASYGLGEEFAYAFAEAGADLILTARSEELLQAVAKNVERVAARLRSFLETSRLSAMCNLSSKLASLPTVKLTC